MIKMRSKESKIEQMEFPEFIEGEMQILKGKCK